MLFAEELCEWLQSKFGAEAVEFLAYPPGDEPLPLHVGFRAEGKVWSLELHLIGVDQ